MGLGWFVQFYRGERVVWHFGHVPNAYSSLDPQAAGEGHHVHPARQQRRTERAVPAARRRRDAFAVRDAVSQADHLA